MKTCLIVDDSRVIRKVARRILEQLGFEVCEAGDGAEALAYCRSEMPTVILLDWRMPVMDGLTFLASCASRAGTGPRSCSARSRPPPIASARRWRPVRTNM